MEVYTIGHSSHQIDDFMALLKCYDIDVIIDVRSAPYSRYVPQYNREVVQQHLEVNGVEYLFAGAQLGGRPKDITCYANGDVDYDLIRRKEWFQQAIDQLIEKISEPGNYALMCSEADPLSCHRHKLLARELVDRDITVLHIKGDASNPTVSKAEFVMQETLF